MKNRVRNPPAPAPRDRPRGPAGGPRRPARVPFGLNLGRARDVRGAGREIPLGPWFLRAPSRRASRGVESPPAAGPPCPSRVVLQGGVLRPRRGGDALQAGVPRPHRGGAGRVSSLREALYAEFVNLHVRKARAACSA